MDVALVHWPSEELERAKLARSREARLLLVETGADPPLCADVLEDWVRLPVSDRDTTARVRSLLARIDTLEPRRPYLEPGGALEFRSALIHLSPLQRELVRPMVEHFGSVVSRDELVDAAWAEASPSDNTLDVNIVRLRRQVRSLGLGIRAVRSRGYMLCPVEAPT